MQKIAIIIPCYNEEKRLDSQKVEELLQKSTITIFFANDGSTDKTLELVKNLQTTSPTRVEIINNEINQGKAATIYDAIQKVFDLNRYDYIGYFDADFSTPVDELVRMLNYLEHKPVDMIFGSRVKLLNSKINRKWQRHIIGRVVITLINFKFNLGVYDTQCGAKIISQQLIPIAFNKSFLTSWLFDVEVFIRLKNVNKLNNAVEFPLLEWKDVEGSKLGWKSAFKIFKEMSLLNKYYKNKI